VQIVPDSPASPFEQETHSFGAGLQSSGKLPTAGSIGLSMTQQSDYSRAVGDSTWKWKQSPAFSVNLDQPLFQGPGVIRFDHAANTLEKAELGLSAAGKRLETAKEQLLLQGLRLFHLRQSLLENRWVLKESISFSRSDLDQLQSDIERGTASRLDLRRKQLEYDQQLMDLADLNHEISGTEIALEKIWTADMQSFFEMIMLPDPELADFIADAAEMGSLLEDGNFYSGVLKHDAEYQSALREQRSAELDRLTGSPADAPRLGAAFSVVPSYPVGTSSSAAGYEDFGESFAKLFGDDAGMPTVSFSITLQIPDVARKQADMQQVMADEQLRAAEAKVKEAALGVKERVQDFQARLQRELRRLPIVFEEYQLAQQDLEEERIRYNSGISNQRQLQQRTAASYRTAFSVLQSLRELSLLSLEMEMMSGE